MKINGAHIVCRVLKEQKTKVVFGYPGGCVVDLFDALYEYKNTIKQIITAHEQGAAHAADGYARASGKCGVVIATSGPGATNLVTGIAAAYMDSVPMVAITGNVSVDDIGKDSFQEVYTEGIMMPVTKHTFVVRDINELAKTLRSAFEIAQSGRCGPVLVDIPKNIFKQSANYKQEKPMPQKGFKTDINKLKEAAEMIETSKRPIVLCGGGVNKKDISEKLNIFINKLNLPCVHTLMATGVVDINSALNTGLCGMHGKISANKALEEADLILALGTRFGDRVVIKKDEFAKKAKVIHVDIDPSEINKNVGVDLSIESGCGEVLDLLLQMNLTAKTNLWLKEIQKFKEKDFKEDIKDFSPYAIINTINKLAPKDTVYTTDVGQHQMWAAQYISASSQSFLTSGGLGAMGYGYGAAIGAKITRKKSPVIHITSDGSFLMNLNETSTAVAYKTNIISIIFNNSGLGMVRQWQDVLCGGRHSGSEEKKKIDYMSLAKGFGAKAFKCQNQQELKEALQAALKSDSCVWIECAVDKEEKVLPMNSAEF